jgi:hypothetical protein
MANIKSLITDVEVNVDCLTAHYNNLVDKGKKALWVLQVESYKESRQWFTEPKGVDDNYHEGRRFNDNDRIVDVILGCMRLQINKYLDGDRWSHEENELSESAFETYVNTVDEDKLNQWINAALHYSAGCDHWYTFEKEW